MSASFDRERVPQRQLGELMTELGMITEDELATVLEVQRQVDRPLGQIIVELGFASGAAVAHALAMQRGGALKTEHGFALGVGPADHRLDDESDARAGIPKLRLAPSAIRPAEKRRPPATADASPGTSRESAAPAGRRAVLAVVPAAEPEPGQQAEEELPPPEPVDVAPAAETGPDEGTDAPRTEQLKQLEAAVERLEGALAEAQTHEQDSVRLQEQRDRAAAELEQLRGEVGRLESELAEVRRSDEEELRQAEEERARVSAELEHLQAAQADAQAAHEQELNRLQSERDRAAVELDHVQATLDGLLEAIDEPVPTLDPSAETPGVDETTAMRETAKPGSRKAVGGLRPGSVRTVTQYHAALRHAYEKAGLSEPAPPSPN